jgi:hypothetical protein
MLFIKPHLWVGLFNNANIKGERKQATRIVAEVMRQSITKLQLNSYLRDDVWTSSFVPYVERNLLALGWTSWQQSRIRNCVLLVWADR